MKQHEWSGWPGAYCLVCGAEDQNEVCLAASWHDDGIDQEHPERMFCRTHLNVPCGWRLMQIGEMAHRGDYSADLNDPHFAWFVVFDGPIEVTAGRLELGYRYLTQRTRVHADS